MRILVRLLIYPALLLAGLWLLLATQFGLVLLLLSGETASLGRLQVEDAHGSLLEGVSFRQLQWSGDGQQARLGSTHLNWRFARDGDGITWHLDQGSVSSLRLTNAEQADDSDAPEASISLPEIALPINVAIHELSIGPVLIDGTPVMDSAILTAAMAADQAVIQHIRIRRPGQSLRVEGELTLSGDWPLTLALIADATEPKQQLQLELTGSMAELAGQWHARGWLSGSGTLAAEPFRQKAELSGELQSRPLVQLYPALGTAQASAKMALRWQQGLRGTMDLSAGSNRLQLRAEASKIHAQLEAPQPELILNTLSGQLSATGVWQPGGKGQLSAVVDWRRLSLPDGKIGDLSANIEGPLDELQLNADLSHPDTALQMTAVALPDADGAVLRLQKLTVRAPDDRNFRLQQATTVRVTPQLIEVPQLCLRADDNSGLCAALQRQHDVLSGQGHIDRFPLGLLSPWMGAGPWDDTLVSGNWQLPGNDTVTLQGWTVTHPKANAQLSGTLGLGAPWPAELSLTASSQEPRQQLSLKTRGTLQQLRAHLTADGHLQGRGELQGDLLSRDLQLQANLISGPLSALLPDLGPWAPAIEMDMRLRQSAIEGRLKLRAGDDRADIRLSDDVAIFDLALTDLAQILPKQTGALVGSGKLPLAQQQGELLLDLDIRDVVMPDAMPLAAKVKLSGTVANHHLTMQALRQDAQLDLALSGALAQSDWRGELTTLSMSLTKGPAFRNEAPASLAYVNERLLLKGLCVKGSSGGALCAEADNIGDVWSTQGTVVDLPLSLLSPWLNLPPWLQTSLNGEWSLDSERGGSAELRHSRIDIPPAGIAVHGSRLLLSGKSLQAMALRTETTLEDGKILGELRMQETAGRWSIDGNLTAPMLTWLQRPDISLQMAPELTASWASGEALVLRGTVTAGKGSVNLDKLPASDGPTLSPDIVTQRKPRKPALPLDMKLQVILDKPLAITGYGFDGSTRGTLKLQQTPSQTLTGNGTIKVAGRYKAWGQDLNISDGRIYFQNSPLSEPLIDVTAHRDVGTYKVGVQALGLARNPQLTVISKPVVNDSVALQMLVTGREPGAAASPTPDQAQLMQQALAALSVKGGNWFAENYGRNLPFDELRVEMDEEAGAPGLVLGRQIAPRLYVGYKVLLDSAVQAFQLRYTLSPSCDLTTTSALTSEGRVRCRIER